MSIQFIKKGGIDTSDATATTNDLAKNKTAYVNGQKITGVLNNKTNQSMSASTVRTSGSNVLFDENYISGGLYVSPGNNFSLYAKNSKVASTIGLTAEKIKKDETILGVTGTYEGSSEYNVKMNTLFTNQNNTILKNITEIPTVDAINLSNINSMFANLEKITEINLINTENINSATNTFNGCKSITTIPLFNTSNITNMSKIFNLCSALTTVPLFDTNKVTDMSYMFYQCNSLTTVPLFDTSNVTNMSYMFFLCNSLTTVPLFNTSNVTNMSIMFQGSALTTVPLFDTNKVTNTSYMFYQCNALTTVPLFDTNKVTNMSYMFGNCNNLSENTLNNILLMCANSAITSNKTLRYIGLTSAQATICQGLSNYQTFLDAGWTTGY